jgi:hypothetical protein
MINTIYTLLVSPDSYAFYLLLKSAEQKVCYCACQLWLMLITIANILNYIAGTEIAIAILFGAYIGVLVYCVKTAIPMED